MLCTPRHHHCGGLSLAPSTDRSHSGRPSAETQQHTLDTCCHRCTPLHHSPRTRVVPHSAACLERMHHTLALYSRCASRQSHCSSCSQWPRTHSMARSQEHSPSIADHPMSTDPHMHRSLCAVCWADDPPRIEHTVSRLHCTRTSPSAKDSSHMLSSQHSADSPHCTARKDHLSQTRMRRPPQSRPDILCGW